MENFILVGQPGTGVREAGLGKKIKSIKFLSHLSNYDLYYGKVETLPDWVKLPENSWAYDMHGFYDEKEIQEALSSLEIPSFVLSYVPNNGKKAQSAAETSAKNSQTFVLVYSKNDKANFLAWLRNNEYNPIGLVDDQNLNCKLVTDKGFQAIHCNMYTDPEFKEEDTKATKDNSFINLAENTTDLISLLSGKLTTE